MGICSRLYKLCHSWVNQIEECYHMLYTWSSCFPSGMKQKEEKLFVLSNNLDCQADTLKLARDKYAQELMKLKSSNQHKVHLETYMANQAIVSKVQELKKELKDASRSISSNDDDLMDFEDLGGKYSCMTLRRRDFY